MDSDPLSHKSAGEKWIFFVLQILTDKEEKGNRIPVC
jgi:hypothetical protein